MEQVKGKVIVVSGSSGAGKGTVLKKVFSMMPDLKLSVSATTRAPRPAEVDGRDYFFVTRQKFENMVENNEFVEYTSTYTNYYGTPKAQLQSALDEGDKMILEINVVGAVNIKKMFPQAITIFITPPSMQVLFERLKNRNTEDEDALKRRIAETVNELEYIKEYDYLVVNDSAQKCAEDIVDIIKDDTDTTKFEVKNNINIINFLKGENIL